MRKHVKVLANFLGAAKELTGEYVDLADITEDEQNQIAFTVLKRADRKTEAKRLAAKGLSTREIAEITGWDYSTISRDLQAMKRVVNATKTVANATSTKPSATGSVATKDGVGSRYDCEGFACRKSDKNCRKCTTRQAVRHRQRGDQGAPGNSLRESQQRR